MLHPDTHCRAPPKPAAAPPPPTPTAAVAAKAAVATKEQLQEAKAAALRDLRIDPTSRAGPSAVKPLPTPPSAAAPLKGAAAATEAAPAQVHTLAAYPQLAHFMQIKEAKPQKPAPTVAALVVAPPPQPSPSSVLSLKSQEDFPPVNLLAPSAIPPMSTLASNAWPPAAGMTLASAEKDQPKPAPEPAQSAAAAAPSPPPAARQQQQQQPLPAPGSSSPFPIVQQQQQQVFGMEALSPPGGREEDCDSKLLTKAQRKNLKRAERKNRLYMRTRVGLDGDAGSDEDDEDDLGLPANGSLDSAGFATSGLSERHEAAAEEASVLEEMFVQSLVCCKAMAVMSDVQRLSFTWWQAAAVVQRFGGDIAAGVAWLLEHANSSIDEVAVMPLGGGHGGGWGSSWPELDVGRELQSLDEAQASFGLGPGDVQAAVIKCLGDVRQSLALLAAQSSARQQQSMRQDPVANELSFGFARVSGQQSDFLGGPFLTSSRLEQDLMGGGGMSQGELTFAKGPSNDIFRSRFAGLWSQQQQGGGGLLGAAGASSAIQH